MLRLKIKMAEMLLIIAAIACLLALGRIIAWYAARAPYGTPGLSGPHP